MIESAKVFRDKILQKIYGLRFNDLYKILKINHLARLTDSQRRKLSIHNTVRLIANFPGLWHRTISQTPKNSCIFGNTLFVASGTADYYLILNSVLNQKTGMMPEILNNVPKDRVLALHMEPSDYIRLLGYNNTVEHERVGRFYTNDLSLYEKGGIYVPCPPYVHWHTGKTFDFHSNNHFSQKLYDIGVIVSDLSTLEGHKKRLKFIEQLDNSSLNVAIWGRGEGLKRFRNYKGFILDKWSAHTVSKFSLVIENSIAPHYWSEKVADCILSGSIPIYHGCPNLQDYIPPNSFIKIDIESTDALDFLSKTVKEVDWNSYSSALLDAKSLILNKHNLYAFIDSELKNM